MTLGTCIRQVLAYCIDPIGAVCLHSIGPVQAGCICQMPGPRSQHCTLWCYISASNWPASIVQLMLETLLPR